MTSRSGSHFRASVLLWAGVPLTLGFGGALLSSLRSSASSDAPPRSVQRNLRVHVSRS